MKDNSLIYHYKSTVLPPPGKKRLLFPPFFYPCHLLRTRENTDAAADFRPAAPPPQLRFDRSFAWSPLSPFHPIVDTTNASLRISVLNRLCSKLIASLTLPPSASACPRSRSASGSNLCDVTRGYASARRSALSQYRSAFCREAVPFSSAQSAPNACHRAEITASARFFNGSRPSNAPQTNATSPIRKDVSD